MSGGEIPERQAPRSLGERLRTLRLDTPFDYRTQAYVGAPVDIPEPNQPQFVEAIEPIIRRAIEISGGRAFVLFTNYRLLNRVHDRLRYDLARAGCTILKQGQMNRHALLEQFKRSTNPVLFATSSFWEGVDVQGDQLRLLILARLPFEMPSDPVLEARVEAIDRRGGNAFMELTVPAAVIRFRQGFGRLIRSKSDRGAILLLDPRIATRPYGQIFLRSLPTEAVHVDRTERVLEEMARFLEFR